MTNDAAATGAPRFDVVLRGYDRKQVDEHVARMQRIIGRMRSDLEVARSQPLPVITPAATSPAPSPSAATGPARPQSVQPPPVQPFPHQPPADRPRPSPRPRNATPPDVVGSFTDRMQSILQTAEEEAEEIRKKAHGTAWRETQSARAEVAELARQRDVMVSELNRMRGQLESMLTAPTTRMPAHQPAPRPAGPITGGPITGGPITGEPSTPPPGLLPPSRQQSFSLLPSEPATAVTPLPAPPAAPGNGAEPPVDDGESYRGSGGRGGGDQNGGQRGDVEATVKVAVVRPGSGPATAGDPAAEPGSDTALVRAADDRAENAGHELDESRDHSSAPSRSG